MDAFGERGLGLGSETSQINAVIHTDKIDHYIKEKARVKDYSKYMDDSLIIHPDLEFLKNLFETLKEYYAKFGVTINEKKDTYIRFKTRVQISANKDILN